MGNLISCILYGYLHAEIKTLPIGTVDVYVKAFQWNQQKYRVDRSVKDQHDALAQAFNIFIYYY